MNKQELYYIPNMEEFYIGFEYEVEMYMINTAAVNSKEELIHNITWQVECGISSIPCTKVWVKKTYSIKDNITNTGTVTRLRVKHLDNIDLGECRFTVGKLPYQYFDGIYRVVDLDYGKIRIDHIADEQCLFYGEIKNLSEFKRLLKQLDIQYGKNN